METRSEKQGKKNGKNERVPRELAEANGTTIDLAKIDPARYMPKVWLVPITIAGVTPLLVHNFSEKSRQEMLAKQTGEARGKKAPKDPIANFERSKYLDAKKRDCFPSGCVRAAMITAARLVDGVSMAELKQAIYVHGMEGPHQDLLPLKFSRIEMDERYARNETGVADIRHRAMYHDWKLSFVVRAVQNVVTAEQICQLVEHAGLGGLGELRAAAKKGLGGGLGQFRLSIED